MILGADVGSATGTVTVSASGGSRRGMRAHGPPRVACSRHDRDEPGVRARPGQVDVADGPARVPADLVQGDLQGRLRFRSPEEAARAKRMGVKEESFIYGLEDIDRGADALSRAQRLGFTAGTRERTRRTVTVSESAARGAAIVRAGGPIFLPCKESSPSG